MGGQKPAQSPKQEEEKTAETLEKMENSAHWLAFFCRHTLWHIT